MASTAMYHDRVSSIVGWVVNDVVLCSLRPTAASCAMKDRSNNPARHMHTVTHLITPSPTVPLSNTCYGH